MILATISLLNVRSLTSPAHSVAGDHTLASYPTVCGLTSPAHSVVADHILASLILLFAV